MRLAIGASRAPSTMEKYAYHWVRFRDFCVSTGVRFIPASPLHVALYLTHKLSTAKTATALEGPRDAISAFHKNAGLPSPTLNPLVQAVIHGAKRMLAQPVQKKEPLELGHVQTIVTRFAFAGAPLQDLMICTAIAVGFFGFFRYSDLAEITVDNVQFHSTHAAVFLPKRKNDQQRQGGWTLLAACPGTAWCPVALLRRLILAGRLTGPRPVFADAYGTGFLLTPLPYHRARELMLAKFTVIGLAASHFGTHSLRAGGATLAANLGVDDKLWMEHGGWRSQSAALGYVRTSVAAKLSVTTAMRGGIPAPPRSSAPSIPLVPSTAAPAAVARPSPAPPSAPRRRKASSQSSLPITEGPDKRPVDRPGKRPTNL